MNSNLPPIKVFAGEASRYLGESICKDLGIELGKMKKERFADGEFEMGFEESIRGAQVEHEISVISALQAINAMNPEKYNVIPVYISKQGRCLWLTGVRVSLPLWPDI